MTREKSIDFFRGLAALNIIMIHTVFHSGAEYVPWWFQQIFLLLDVPAFFFLAGWSNAFNNAVVKSLQSIKKLWIDWAVFCVCAFGAVALFFRDGVNLYHFVQAVFSFRFEVGQLPSVAWSTWFMPVYIWVVLFFGITTKYAAGKLTKEDNKKFLQWLLAGLALLFMAMHFLSGEWVHVFRPIVAYGFVFVAGYYCKDVEINWKQLAAGILGLVALWFGSAKVFSVSFWNLQGAKFPPTILYLAASGISILFIVFLKHRIPEKWMNNAVCHVGKNAICYYFAQGVGASVLFRVAPHFSVHWLLKCVVCFCVNLVITIAVAEVFRLIKRVLHCK